MSTSKNRWKIGFNTFWWEGLDKPENLDGCINSLVEIGYDAVEFKVDSFGPQPAKEAIVRAANVARKAGLEVSNLVILRGISQPDICEKSIKDISEAIHICAEAEIGALNFATGAGVMVATASGEDWWELPPTRPDPISWDTLIKSLEKLCGVAEKEGVDLALEAVIGNLVSEFSTTLELFERFDHPRLKLTFDPSHYVLAGQDVGVGIRRLGQKIRHVHFKDAAGRVGSMGKDFIFPFLGEGNTDWQSFFGALKDINYDGVLSIEFESFRYMNIILEGNAVEAAKVSRHAADKLIKRYGS